MGSDAVPPRGVPSWSVTTSRTWWMPSREAVTSRSSRERAPGARSSDVGVGDLEDPSVAASTRTVTGWSSPLTTVAPRVPSSLESVTDGGATTSMSASWSSS